jgi:hypothetical protein
VHPLILGYLGTCSPFLLLHDCRLLDERVTSHQQIPILVHLILLEVLFMTRGLTAYHSPGCFLDFPRLGIDGPALRGGRPLSLGCLHGFLNHNFGRLREIIEEEVRFHDGLRSRHRGSSHGGRRLPPLENVLSIHD